MKYPIERNLWFYSVFLLIDYVRTVSAFLPYIRHKEDWNESSRLEQNKIRTLLYFSDKFFLALENAKEKEAWIYFTQQSSFKDSQGREKSAWLEVCQRENIKGWYNKSALYSILRCLHSKMIINVWDTFLDFCRHLDILWNIYSIRHYALIFPSHNSVYAFGKTSKYLLFQ